MIDQLTLASRLKDARVAAKLTQEQVAKALDLSPVDVVQIEAGNRAVSTLELANLAQLYGRTIASFFDFDETASEEGVKLMASRSGEDSISVQPNEDPSSDHNGDGQ